MFPLSTPFAPPDFFTAVFTVRHILTPTIGLPGIYVFFLSMTTEGQRGETALDAITAMNGGGGVSGYPRESRCAVMGSNWEGFDNRRLYSSCPIYIEVNII